METTGAFSTQGNTWSVWKQKATPPPPRTARWATTWELPAATSPSPKPTWQGSRKSWGNLGSSPSACPCGGSGSGLGNGGSADRAQFCQHQPSCSTSESCIAQPFLRISLSEAFLLVELDVGLSVWQKTGSKDWFKLKWNKPWCLWGEGGGKNGKMFWVKMKCLGWFFCCVFFCFCSCFFACGLFNPM